MDSAQSEHPESNRARESGMEMTDESGVTGGMSGKIRSVRVSENAGDGDRRGGEGVREGGEGEGGGITSNAFK